MNDLERDVRGLLDDDASRAPLVTSPPDRLRTRVRRRQLRTAVAGGTAFLVVAGIVGAATWVGLSEREAIPAGNDGPMRVTVDRFTIDVPSGWIALDTSFTPLVMATESETCSFSSEGVPVTGGTTTDAGQDLETPSEDRERCTREPVTYPAGLPLLQLMQRDVSDVDQTGCGNRIGEGRDETGANAFADADAGFYLALLPAVTGLPPWPVALEDGDGPCGEGSYARFSVGDDAYLAFAGFGPEVAPETREALLAAVADMDVHDVTRPDVDLPIAGPAVFLASGDIDGTRWQVSAGVSLDAGIRNVPTAWAELVGTDGTITDTVSVPWNGDGPNFASMSHGDREIAVALLPDAEVDPAWESDDGTLTELSTAAAPGIMALPPTPFSGRVGWAVAPGGPGTLVGEDAVGANVQPTYEPAPGAEPIESAYGSNDWYSWRVTVQEQANDTWWVVVSAVGTGSPRHEHVVWSGSVAAGTQAGDAGSPNVVAIDLSDSAPTASILLVAFLPADAEHVGVSLPDGTEIRTARDGASAGTFVPLGDLDPNVVAFANSYEGTSIATPFDVEVLDADLEPIVTLEVDRAS